MKRNLYIIMVCCAAALVSCKKTETDTPTPGTDPEPQPEGKAVLYGSLGETTKTYLHTDDNENTFKVLWEKDDAIAIIIGGAKTAEYATRGQGVYKARFEFNEGTQLNVGETFETIYPAGLVKSGVGDALSLVWPAEQEYKVIGGSNPGEAGNNPMWASATVKEPVTEMQFYNLGGVIRFKISQPSKAFSVVLATLTADQPLSGSCSLKDTTITVGEEQKTIKKAKITPETKSGSIIIKPSSAVSITKDKEASFCFAVPEGTYYGVKFTFVCDNGERFTAQLNPGKTLTVSRAAVTRLKASGITPTDITVDGSNCFIGEGNVPIVITAMGNAFDGKTALDGNNANAVWKAIKGNANDCKIVWETENTATKPADNTIIKSVSFDATNGVLTVVPTGTPGNALVAITDASDNIVWSYHIWVPDTNNSPMSNVSVNGVTFMDRNIGALKAADPNQTDNTKSIGLLYQWGRKDPLLSFVDFNGKQMMNGWTKTTINRSTGSQKDYDNIKNSIQNPSSIIVASTTSSAAWIEGLGHLWGTSATYNCYDVPTIHSKSIYDPCPSGYRVVPEYTFYQAMGNKGSGDSSKNNNTITVGALYFPANYILAGTTSSDQIRLWTATRRCGNGAPETFASTSWDIRTTNYGAQWGIGSYYDGHYACYSANVRCVKDTYKYTTN